MASTNWAGEDANANHRRVSDRNARQARERQQVAAAQTAGRRGRRV